MLDMDRSIERKIVGYSPQLSQCRCGLVVFLQHQRHDERDEVLEVVRGFAGYEKMMMGMEVGI